MKDKECFSSEKSPTGFCACQRNPVPQELPLILLTSARAACLDHNVWITTAGKLIGVHAKALWSGDQVTRWSGDVAWDRCHVDTREKWWTGVIPVLMVRRFRADSTLFLCSNRKLTIKILMHLLQFHRKQKYTVDKFFLFVFFTISCSTWKPLILLNWKRVLWLTVKPPKVGGNMFLIFCRFYRYSNNQWHSQCWAGSVLIHMNTHRWPAVQYLWALMFLTKQEMMAANQISLKLRNAFLLPANWLINESFIDVFVVVILLPGNNAAPFICLFTCLFNKDKTVVDCPRMS